MPAKPRGTRGDEGSGDDLSSEGGSASSCSSSLSDNESTCSDVSDEASARPGRGLGLGMDFMEQEQSSVMVRLRLARAHQLRKLLSLRHARPARSVSKKGSSGGGSGARAAEAGFFERDAYLGDSEAAVMSLFSNRTLFEALLASIRTAATAPDRKGPPSLEAAASTASPLFCLGYTMPTPSTVSSTLGDTATLRYVEEEPQHAAWWRELQPCKRSRRDDKTDPSAGARAAGTTRAVPRATQADSSSLVAKSMRRWETHLAAELTTEGESIENYRQRKGTSSAIEEDRFRQEAQWNEYMRERKLEEEQREMAERRAIRRGETQ